MSIDPVVGSYETVKINSIGLIVPSALIIGNLPSTAPINASFAFVKVCAGSSFIILSNSFLRCLEVYHLSSFQRVLLPDLELYQQLIQQHIK